MTELPTKIAQSAGQQHTRTELGRQRHRGTQKKLTTAWGRTFKYIIIIQLGINVIISVLEVMYVDRRVRLHGKASFDDCI